MSICLAIPRALRAGDTWEWIDELPDYPAPTWTLTYTLYSADGVITLVAIPDGENHKVLKTPAETTLYAPGRYDWSASVADVTNRYSVGTGGTRVLADVESALTHDGRSHARKMLDSINAILENRASAGDVDLVKASVSGRNVENDIEMLLKMRQQYAAQVQAEEHARLRECGHHPGFVQWRFGR